MDPWKVVSALVAAAALAFGLWQYASKGAFERGAHQTLLRELDVQVKRLERTIEEQRQINTDIRLGLTRLEHALEYQHGEVQTGQPLVIREIQP